MFSVKISSVKGLKQVAKRLLSEFPGQRVFAFYGKMGAGKTTFIQAICEALGTGDNVTSPTFAIINEYKTKDLSSIFHFDFYRIKDIEEAFDLGYEDYLYSGAYCFIEWPGKIGPLLPKQIVEVNIEADDKENRIISARIA
jgi:tRNA threonylcarbamoyladenosine biosynthesis protein TsaE